MAWVDPAHGDDSSAEVNDPDQPFKTLQAAILAVENALVFAWNSPVLIYGRDEMQGTVIALPGIYGPVGGPNGPDASGDDLPILLLDRVHVQGVAADRCIIRETRDETNAIWQVYWPQAGGPCTSSSKFIRPLVLLTPASVAEMHPQSVANTVFGNPRLPWYDDSLPTAGQDTTEVFDRFTLQGGSVQMVAATDFIFPYVPRVIISNCVFDMRDGWKPAPLSAAVTGPTFGI